MDVLTLFSITPFPRFSKDRCVSRKKDHWKKFRFRAAQNSGSEAHAPRSQSSAPRVTSFFCVFFFFVCVFFFNSRDWLRRKGMTARRLFQMLSNVFIIDSPFGGNIHWNQSWSDVLTHCLFTCRFIRNLLYFYKPSSQRFCTVHISDPQARTFSEVGCLLIDFLLDGEDVRYNFCSKGSGVKGLVWGSVNNQARWHVQVKLFYFLLFYFGFCFVFVSVFVLFFFKILMVGFDWKASLSLNQASHYLSMCLSVCLYKRGQVSKETVVLRRWVV